MSLVHLCVRVLCDLLAVPPLVLLSLVARWRAKPIDVGIGPQPMINNVYHAQALRQAGFSAETFVNQVYFVTEQFDVRGDLWPTPRLARLFAPYLLCARVMWRYRALYTYFRGGPLAWTRLLPSLEPHLYRLARVKVLVMAYGADVHDLSRYPNLAFRHAMSVDYPQFKNERRAVMRRIDRWIRHGDLVLSGCDWVYTMHHWDHLQISHFSIDTEVWAPDGSVPPTAFSPTRPLRLLHAPNHRAIKGTDTFLAAVATLQREGLPIDLDLAERLPNDEIRARMRQADVVLDQLVVGWYAMFAIEAMALGKPVVCFLADDLLRFYTGAGLLVPGEIPILNTSRESVTALLRELVTGCVDLRAAGALGREYVLRHHSLGVMGQEFLQLNRRLGIRPRDFEAGRT